ncbi:MAG: PaaI family thioesterase [Gemmatimonadota bacterium]
MMQPWQPKNPDYITMVADSLSRQPMMATLGARLSHLAPGEADLTAPFDRRFTQQNGFWHAGAVACLADSANGYAAFSLAPAGSDVLAVEFKINLLAPAQAAVFLAQGRVVRPGKTLTVCLAEVFGTDGTERTLIATMLSTLIIRQIPKTTA